MDMIMLFSNILLISLGVNIAISIYGIVSKPNMVKKLIAITILSDTVNVIAIVIGYRLANPPIPPIHALNDDYRVFITRVVDPIPQALVLTAIVIGLALIIFLVFLTLRIFRVFGSVNLHEVLETMYKELPTEAHLYEEEPSD